jgi:hypothetical protein
MRKGKRILYSIGVLVCAVLCCLPFFGAARVSMLKPAPTDAGDYNDYDDGGSDWGGSDDWGSDDWDSDDSDDDSDGGGGLYGLLALVLFFPAAVIVAFIRKSARKKHEAASGSSTVPHASQKGMPTVRDHTDEIVAAMLKTDSYFSAGRFIEFAKQTFFTLQNAWMRRDLTPMRDLETEQLYDQHKMQIDRYIADGRINVLERINVSNAYLQRYVRDRDFEHLTVFMQTRMTDYIIDERTKRVLKGSPDRDSFLTYLYTFTRKAGSSSKETKAGACVHCGAPYQLTSDGKCNYCGGTLTTVGNDWLLSNINAVKPGTTVDDDGVKITG